MGFTCTLAVQAVPSPTYVDPPLDLPEDVFEFVVGNITVGAPQPSSHPSASSGHAVSCHMYAYARQPHVRMHMWLTSGRCAHMLTWDLLLRSLRWASW